MGKEGATVIRAISKSGRAQSSAILVNNIKQKLEKQILQTQEKTKIQSLSINKNSENIQKDLQRIQNINIAKKARIIKTGKGQKAEVKKVIHKTKNLKVKSKIIQKAIHLHSLSKKNTITELAHIVHDVGNCHKLPKNITKDVMQNFAAILHSSNLNLQQKTQFVRIVIPKLPLNAINSLQRYIDNNFSTNAVILQSQLSNTKLPNTEMTRLSNLQQYNTNTITPMPLSNNLYSYNLEFQDFTRQYSKNILSAIKFNDENNDGIIDIKDVKYEIEKELHNLYPNEYPNPQIKDVAYNIDEEVYNVRPQDRHKIEDAIVISNNDIQKMGEDGFEGVLKAESIFENALHIFEDGIKKEDSGINLEIDGDSNLNLPEISNDSYSNNSVQGIKDYEEVKKHSFVENLEKQRSAIKQQNFEVSI